MSVHAANAIQKNTSDTVVSERQPVSTAVAYVAAAYIPFYLYRTRIEDKRVAREEAGKTEAVMPPGAVPSK